MNRLSQSYTWNPHPVVELTSDIVVFWLISIQIFGAVAHYQNGATTRVLFITATIHL